MRILISGGGTGGHIFPAIAIANAIRRRHPDADILFVGARGRMEMQRVPDAGYKIEGLPVAGFDRRRLWRNIPVLFKLAHSLMLARRIVRSFSPDIAVGVGGYASGPILKAAQRRRIPTILQEQNSYAGVTNKLLARRARKICVAYPDMQRYFDSDKIVTTGNPVRQDVLRTDISAHDARRALNLDPDRPVLMVTGGSLGSRTINEAMALAVNRFADSNISVVWQTGKVYYDQYRKYDDPARGIHVMQFIDDMGLNYAAASLVVARAGALTISELQILGKAAILIPSPNVAEDHQHKNAMALVSRDAAILVEDADAARLLGDIALQTIADDNTLAALSRNISLMALPDADNTIAQIIDDIVAHH